QTATSIPQQSNIQISDSDCSARLPCHEKARANHHSVRLDVSVARLTPAARTEPPKTPASAADSARDANQQRKQWQCTRQQDRRRDRETISSEGRQVRARRHQSGPWATTVAGGASVVSGTTPRAVAGKQ
ncbi:hypothetical protein BaRGS_00003997, partial [Batillaria attramentaria]